MSERVEDRYFEWLYGHFAAVSNRNPSRSHWELARKLHSREFVWLVANDDNRVEDGKELRMEFIHEEGTDDVDMLWIEVGCSVLEMLVALADRAAFETSRAPGHWFGVFLKNLGLDKYDDAHWTDNAHRHVDRKLDQLIYRTYSPTGRGGIFPLQAPAEDQRRVELWYQMSAYFIEKQLF